MLMANDDFLGRGMKFPPSADKSTGRFAVSSGAQSVKESLYIILMTSRGERWLLPGFGTRLSSYAFMDTSLTMLSIMQRELRTAILEQEPRIADVDITMSDELRSDCILININYTLAGQNTIDNLVFPFYLNVVSEGIDDESLT